MMVKIRKRDSNFWFYLQKIGLKITAQKSRQLLFAITAFLLIPQGLLTRNAVAQEVLDSSEKQTAETVNNIEQVRQYSQDLTRSRRKKRPSGDFCFPIIRCSTH
jgi:hypothetical protein